MARATRKDGYLRKHGNELDIGDAGIRVASFTHRAFDSIERTKKGLWIVAALVLPLVGYLVWLYLSDTPTT